MIITKHGTKKTFYKGLAKHAGIKLAFFGHSKEQVQASEKQWLREHMPELTAREMARPALRVVKGGRK